MSEEDKQVGVFQAEKEKTVIPGSEDSRYNCTKA